MGKFLPFPMLNATRDQLSLKKKKSHFKMGDQLSPGVELSN